MKFTFPKDVAYKDDIATLNIIAAVAKQGWKRPLYFDGGLPGDNYIGLGDYMKLEGVVYRLLPYKKNDSVKTPQGGDIGSVNLDKSYDLFMNKYIWGGADRNDVYFDEKNRIMFAAYRLNSARIANELTAVGRKADAVKLLDKVVNGITERSYFYDYIVYYMAAAYYNAGDMKGAHNLTSKLVRNSEDDINWITTLSDSRKDGEAQDAQRDLAIINMLGNTAQSAGDTTTARDLNKKLQMLLQKVGPLVNRGQQQQ